MGFWMAAGIGEDDKLDRVATAKVLRRTVAMLRPYRRHAIAALGLLVVFAFTTMAGPLLVRRAIDTGLTVGDRGALNESIVAYIVVAIVAYFAYRAAIVQLATAGEGFLRDLRVRVFDRMLHQSMSFYDRENAGVLVSRMTSDVDSLQVLVRLGLLLFVSASFVVLASLITLVFLDPLLLVLCLVTMPVVAWRSVKFHRDSNKALSLIHI